MKFKHLLTCIVASPTCSGKTSFVIKLLRKLESLCTDSSFKGGIIWCYSEEIAVPSQQLNKLGQNSTSGGATRNVRQRQGRTFAYNS